MKKYAIKSIFGPTIQGEGSMAGTVVCFVRFAGCNRWSGLEKDRAKSVCSFCDTDFRGGEKLTKEEIVERLALISRSQYIVLSGGEPTLQIDEELLSHLMMAGFKLCMETNGSKDIGNLRSFFHHITMSPKQSMEDSKLKGCDDLKLLYPPPMHAVTMEKFSSFPSKNKFLQPVFGPEYEANVRATLCRLYGDPDWKLSLQTHKIIGVE